MKMGIQIPQKTKVTVTFEYERRTSKDRVRHRRRHGHRRLRWLVRAAVTLMTLWRLAREIGRSNFSQGTLSNGLGCNSYLILAR